MLANPSTVVGPWKGRGFHVDSIGLRLHRKTGDDLTRLPELCDLRQLAGTVTCRPSPGSPFAPPRHSRVLVHRPDREAFELLDAISERYDADLNELAVALEVEAGSPTDAQHRAEWLSQRIRVPWARSPWTYAPDGEFLAFYSSRKSWNVDRVVIYARESKLEPGQWSVRVERRVAGRPVVARVLRGVTRPSDTLDVPLEGLLGRVAFEEPDLVKLGRQARGRSRAKLPDGTTFGPARQWYDNDESAGSTLVIQAAIRSQEPWLFGSAMAVRAHCRGREWFRPESCMIPFESPLPIGHQNLRFPPLTGSTL
jgi:hypothetical protein